LDFKGPDGEKPDFGRYMDNNSLKEIWLHSLNVREISSGKSYKIDKVYAEIFSFRGYDTSKVDDVREEPVHMVQKGSVIVFKTEKTFNEIFDDFALIRGFGLDVDNGLAGLNFILVWRCIK